MGQTFERFAQNRLDGLREAIRKGAACRESVRRSSRNAHAKFKVQCGLDIDATAISLADFEFLPAKLVKLHRHRLSEKTSERFRTRPTGDSPVAIVRKKGLD
jgi:hypothetical protein